MAFIHRLITDVELTFALAPYVNLNGRKVLPMLINIKKSCCSCKHFKLKVIVVWVIVQQQEVPSVDSFMMIFESMD